MNLIDPTISGLQVLSIETLLAKISLKKTSLYRLINTEGFPQPIKLGRKSGWLEHEVDAWLLQKSRNSKTAS
ncbi:AlpA family phage regulatory protein [Methylovorus menthalis]|uniref:helix-turn-helix transcriptional regulator n=1 Tax=Methylovorus menthalis TaxID=1002227 RepID=UPI001E2CBB17|nr:AlpA family phage regulatory protein [Methylovorus menthalis]MCB4811671.1 AlpA family phage regulatory protein [Methylovorus menthalis]